MNCIGHLPCLLRVSQQGTFSKYIPASPSKPISPSPSKISLSEKVHYSHIQPSVLSCSPTTSPCAQHSFIKQLSLTHGPTHLFVPSFLHSPQVNHIFTYFIFLAVLLPPVSRRRTDEKPGSPVSWATISHSFKGT